MQVQKMNLEIVLLRHGQIKRHQIIMKNLICNQMLLLHKKTCRLNLQELC